MFKKQIKKNIFHKIASVNKSIDKIIDAIYGKTNINFNESHSSFSKDALNKILKFYKIKPLIFPTNLKTLNSQIDFVIKHSGLATRNIKLTDNWFSYSDGAILASKKADRTSVALLPSNFYGYYYINLQGKKVKINKKNKDLFAEDALLFYDALPQRSINLLDIIIFLKKAISPFDFIFLIFISFAATTLGLLTPKIVKFIFSSVVAIKNLKLLTIVGIFMITATIGEHLFQTMKIILIRKITTKLTLKLETAIIIRVLNLPVSFFKRFNSSEIFTKINLFKNFCQSLVENSLQTIISCLFSLSYFFQIFSFTKQLVIPTIVLILITSIVSIISTITRSNIGFKRMDAIAKENATCLEIITGIEKIKLTGSEKYAYARWAEKFAENAKISYNPPFILKINKFILNAINLIGIIILYVIAAIYKITPINFVAFNLAYTAISGSFFKLSETSLEIARIKPMLKIMKPILNAYPEINVDKHTINQLHGKININNLTFAYDNSNNILKNLSININPRQSVAIIGQTGCGKSTLLRLLIGFETPTTGTIFFDDIDINSIDIRSIRKKMGVVIQNGRLFNGNIFSNIAANRNISLKQAWRAAQIAHIDHDIENMPMRMNTLITREGFEFSSGQIQQILIARAVALKPKILIFDDAMSTLNNQTQNNIIKSIMELNCTKIIFTNQFSDLSLFDQVIFLENGQIIKTIYNNK